ncbi:putative O-linked GlcNAc transferase [Rickettsia sibirica 246]|uniref:O-linked GlcNAc transferase n=1 Tax=Rickettsia sibirica (strain ATCC VR-151 / 246) TaxID=272951 RepID=Q7PAA1_RICS2|nr:putative O-linked GlcNAc transferase [Rickettsia sibirica 246]
MKFINKAIALNSNHFQAYLNKGAVINPYAYNNKAEILRKLEKYELALEAYNKAIEIDPNYSDAYFNKSKLFDELGNYEVALEAYDRALTYRHDDDLDYSDIYII